MQSDWLTRAQSGLSARIRFGFLWNQCQVETFSREANFSIQTSFQFLMYFNITIIKVRV